MMNKRRRSKTLEKAARAVRDTDEFVEHVFSIARGFAAHHELDTGAGIRGVRQALRTFDKHAGALAQWLKQSSRAGSAEHQALATLGGPETAAVSDWLQRHARAASTAEGKLAGTKLRQAPRFAARALRATFEHHKLKVSHQVTAKKQSDAVQLLCAIARDGGDPTVTAAQARAWLIESTHE
jgi:hypothetical protein